MRAIVMWIVWRKLLAGRSRMVALAGIASATPMRSFPPLLPVAARAAAGKAMQAIRARMKYVCFVSKRGTVAVFAGSERDRTHTRGRASGYRHTLRHGGHRQFNLLKRIVQ